jgi:hypothetical protein
MIEFNELLARRVAQRMLKQAAEMQRESFGEVNEEAHVLELEVRAFLAGLNHAWPKGWEEEVCQTVKECDPDWKEYQRLQQKFKHIRPNSNGYSNGYGELP